MKRFLQFMVVWGVISAGLSVIFILSGVGSVWLNAICALVHIVCATINYRNYRRSA